jgi:DNA replication protein DnaC
MSKRTKTPTKTPATPELFDQLLDDFAALRIPLRREQLQAVLRRAEQEQLPHLHCLQLLIGTQAAERRERGIAHRIKQARFRDVRTLATFDWNFNASAIDRVQIEELATGAFTGRHDNLVLVGQSGVGKSHIIQAIGRQACVHYRVRYTTSASLLQDLTASLAGQTLPKRVRYWAGFELLIIDEFGFDRIERLEARQAASLLYKVIDARSPQRSTALVTNIDFDAWGDYLEDPPLATAFLDRIVDGATIVKIKGKSYRAHRAQQQPKKAKASGK